jgi:hypothetical protein
MAQIAIRIFESTNLTSAHNECSPDNVHDHDEGAVLAAI